MTSLKLPLWIAGILSLLHGLACLSPDMVKTLFDYEVKDTGLLALVAGLFISLGVVTVAAAANVERYGGLACAFALVQVVGVIILAWQWAVGTFTARNALASLIIAAVLAVWLWLAKPKA
jgi:hypothetical protein